jgi:hypothetical protein
MNRKRISKAIAATVAVMGIAAPVAQAHYSATDGQGDANSPALGVQIVADRPDLQPNPALDRGVQIVTDRPDVRANPADRGVQVISDRPEFRTNPGNRTRVVSQPDSGTSDIGWTNVGIASGLGLGLLLMAATGWYASGRRDGQVAAA